LFNYQFKKSDDEIFVELDHPISNIIYTN